MMKIFKIIFIFLLVIIIILGLGVYWIYKEYREANKVIIYQENGTTKIKIDEPEKELLKDIAKAIKKFVYREAEIHNPEGDVLPDQIDNNIIKEIKNKVE